MSVFAKLTWPTGATEIVPFPGILYALKDYMSECHVGDEWKVEFVEMTEAEYEALPEFMGP